MPTDRRITQWALLPILGIGLFAFSGMVWVHVQYATLRDQHTPETLNWYLQAFIAYLGILFFAEKQKNLSLKIIFLGAILFRMLLLLTTPTLSDDIYRYIWDGYVANKGVSPYAYSIDSPALDYLDVPARALANNSWMASPYLPAAQYLFAALTRLFSLSPLPFQVVMVGLDLLNGVLLLKLLAIARLPHYRVLIYLWNPLVIVEVAHSAHVDTWMIFLTLLAVCFTFWPNASRPFLFLAPVMLGLATLTKGLPVLLVAVLFWRWRWWQLLLYGGVVVGLTLPAGVEAGWGLTGPLNGTGLFGALRIYSDQWNFNSGLFYWLETALAEQGVAAANTWAKGVIGLLMFITMVLVWLKARVAQTPRKNLRLMSILLMAYILLTTTLHPWYLMILLAFLPFLSPISTEPRRQWLAVAPWIYLSGVLPLSYLTYLNPLDFRELAWVRKVEWWPTWGLLFIWVGAMFIKSNPDKLDLER